MNAIKHMNQKQRGELSRKLWKMGYQPGVMHGRSPVDAILDGSGVAGDDIVLLNRQTSERRRVYKTAAEFFNGQVREIPDGTIYSFREPNDHIVMWGVWHTLEPSERPAMDPTHTALEESR